MPDEVPQAHRALNVAFGQRVRAFREVRRLSQAELAERVGATQPELSQAESGKGWLSFPQMLAIADELGEPIDGLLAKPVTRGRPRKDSAEQGT